jgi:hypothetical protein
MRNAPLSGGAQARVEKNVEGELSTRSPAFPASALPPTFGPWRPDLDPVERIAQLRSLAGLAMVFLGPKHPLVETLRAAERDDEAAVQALAMLDTLPSLTRRRMLATFARITWPSPRRYRARGSSLNRGAP